MLAQPVGNADAYHDYLTHLRREYTLNSKRKLKTPNYSNEVS